MWNKPNVTPPDQLVEVRNEKGHLARAFPTYYPFIFCKESGKVEPCDPYWDGGWMIECDLSHIFEGKVSEWRLIDETV